MNKYSILFALVFLSSASYAQAYASKLDDTGSVRIARTYHILVGDRTTAEKLHMAIKSVPRSERFSRFKAVARSSSMDPGSAPGGGNLGDVYEGVMVRSFENAIFASQLNEVTGPFQSEFGWHLTYVTKFSSRSVGEICQSSLRTSIASTGPLKSSGMALGLRPVERHSFADEILSLIGHDWSGPFMDGDQNLLYLSTNAAPLGSSLQVATLHSEYIHAKLVAAVRPMACARSMRESLAIDCENELIGRLEVLEFEGRGASGKKLTDFRVALPELRLREVTPGSSDSQVFKRFCGNAVSQAPQ